MATKPEFVIFYAWQSDRPGNGNRYLIQEAAADAASQLNADPAVPYTIRIDQDTQGVPGLCDIPATILTKIAASDSFLCDLTYVAYSESESEESEFEPRFCSNPNVLFELGYAFRTLGSERIVCVMNEHYGPVAEQIFDLAHRRFPITYSSPAGGQTRKQILNLLSTKLVRAFTDLLPLGRRADSNKGDRIPVIREAFENRVRAGRFHGLVRRQGALTIAVIAGPGSQFSHEELQGAQLSPPGASSWNTASRGDAVLAIASDDEVVFSVTEARVDGVIQGADVRLLDTTFHQDKRLLVPSAALESAVIGTAVAYLKQLRKSGAPLPWTICVSLLEVQNYFLFSVPGQDRTTRYSDVDIRPEPVVVKVDNRDLDRQHVAQLVRPILDYIWREFGFSGSPNYTQGGVYSARF